MTVSRYKTFTRQAPEGLWVSIRDSQTGAVTVSCLLNKMSDKQLDYLARNWSETLVAFFGLKGITEKLDFADRFDSEVDDWMDRKCFIDYRDYWNYFSQYWSRNLETGEREAILAQVYQLNPQLFVTSG